MQQATSVLRSCSVHMVKLLVEEKFDLSGDSEDPYYNAIVKSPGYNPRFPIAFEKKIVVINSKLFSHFANKESAEIAIYAGYETVRWMKVDEQVWKPPGGSKKSWLTLSIGIEPIVSRIGVSGRVLTFMLQEAKF